MADENLAKWGEVWGPPYLTDEGIQVHLRHKAHRFRFIDANGQQHGPEHVSILPAMLWAIQRDWDDGSPLWLRRGIQGDITAIAGLRRAAKR